MRPIPRLAVSLAALTLGLSIAQAWAADAWPEVLQEDFDAGKLSPEKWVVYPDPAAIPAFDARGTGKAIHLRSEQGDRGIMTVLRPAPPYRLGFDFMQPGNEAGGYRLVVFHARRDGHAWWLEVNRGDIGLWTTADGGWAQRWGGTSLATDTWYTAQIEDEPSRVRVTIRDAQGKEAASSDWVAHDDPGEADGIRFVAATGGGLRAWLLDNVSLAMPTGAAAHRVAATVDPALHAALQAPRPAGAHGTVSLNTADGLSMTLGGDGAAYKVALDGATISPKGGEGYGGFYAWDITKPAAYQRFTQEASPSNDGTLKLRCEPLALRLNAKFEARTDRIDVTGDLSDTSGKDRAIVLVFVLPIDAAGWTWGDTLEANRPIREMGRYQNNMIYGTGGLRGRHLMSAFPWASVCSPTRGLMLARPLDWPRLMSCVYDLTPSRRLLAVRTELGLSPVTRKFPSHADFRFVFSRVARPEWNLRGAAQRYYELYPDSFVKRVKREGIWHLWVTPKVPNPEDFGLVFHEQEPYSEDRVTSDDINGEYSLTYCESNTLWQRSTAYDKDKHFLPGPFLEAAKQRAEQPLTVTTKYPFVQPKPYPDAELAKALLHSYLGREGEPSVAPAPPDLVAVNCSGDPELPKPNRASLWFDYEGVPALSDPRVDGAYLDSVGWGGFDQAESFRRDQWVTADIPLIPSFSASGPAQLAQFSHQELYGAVAKAMHERGKLVIANTFPYNQLFTAHLLDIMGAGENDKFELFHDAGKLSFCRALAYRKPVSHMNYGYFNPSIPVAQKEQAIQRALVYDIWPGSGNVADPAQIEPIRPLYRKYIPLFGALAAAGWEPTTEASVQPAYLVCERYGAPGRSEMYLAVHNPSTQPAQARVMIGKALAVKDGTWVRDSVSGERYRVAAGAVDVSLAAWQTAILALPTAAPGK